MYISILQFLINYIFDLKYLYYIFLSPYICYNSIHKVLHLKKMLHLYQKTIDYAVSLLHFSVFVHFYHIFQLSFDLSEEKMIL